MNRYIIALFTKHKKKHLPSILQNTWFDEWMSYGYITFLSAFFFQGMLYANWRENVVKLLLDLIVLTLLIPFMNWYWAIFIAHSLNFCLNGQFLCVFYHINAGDNTPQRFMSGVDSLKARLEQATSVNAAIAYGSLSKGKWRPSSDIDVRIIPQSGELAFWKACIWAVTARAVAFFQFFPLDMFVTTMEKAYQQMKKDEVPIIIKDKTDISSSYYQYRMSYEDFRQSFVRNHIKDKTELL